MRHKGKPKRAPQVNGEPSSEHRPASTAEQLQAKTSGTLPAQQTPQAIHMQVSRAKRASESSQKPACGTTAHAPSQQRLKSARAQAAKEQRAQTASAPAPEEQPAQTASAPAPKEQRAQTASAPAPKEQLAQTASAPAPKEQPAQTASAPAPKEQPAQTAAAPAPSQQRAQTASAPAPSQQRAGNQQQARAQRNHGHLQHEAQGAAAQAAEQRRALASHYYRRRQHRQGIPSALAQAVQPWARQPARLWKATLKDLDLSLDGRSVSSSAASQEMSRAFAHYGAAEPEVSCTPTSLWPKTIIPSSASYIQQRLIGRATPASATASPKNALWIATRGPPTA